MLFYTLKLSLIQAPILVLTGPPGTGKTATMRVLAKELGFQLREWITPINNNTYTEDVEGNKNLKL
jgi:broad-specificity NMP kinase